MEDVLKRLLAAERESEERVEKADAERRKMIQDALDQAREAAIAFERDADTRRKPFLDTAEEGARRRIAELEADTIAQQRALRAHAARNEHAVVDAVLARIVGES